MKIIHDLTFDGEQMLLELGLAICSERKVTANIGFAGYS